MHVQATRVYTKLHAKATYICCILLKPAWLIILDSSLNLCVNIWYHLDATLHMCSQYLNVWLSLHTQVKHSSCRVCGSITRMSLLTYTLVAEWIPACTLLSIIACVYAHILLYFMLSHVRLHWSNSSCRALVRSLYLVHNGHGYPAGRF